MTKSKVFHVGYLGIRFKLRKVIQKILKKRKIESFNFTIATLQISCNLIDSSQLRMNLI